MKDARFVVRPESVEMPTRDYSLTYTGGAKKNVNRRAVNYTTWFAIITAAIYVLSLLLFHGE